MTQFVSGEPYAVVLNDLDVDVGDGFPVGGGWILTRPSIEQISQIRPLFQNLDNATNVAGKQTAPPHEYLTTTLGVDGWKSEWSSSPADWRYLVLRRTDPGGLDADALVQALLLSDAGVFADYWPNGEPSRQDGKVSCIMNPAAMTTFFNEHHGLFGSIPTQPDLAEISEVLALRASFADAEYPEIARLLRQFVETFVIPIRSTQSLLACLGIVEGLLSHAPSQGDPVDSITRQLKRNIVLLDHRLPSHRKLELDQFGQMSPERVITNLYAYRSAVAHGGQPDRELQVFYSSRWKAPLHVQTELHLFARRILKRLLTASLLEPQLVSDLKG